MSYGTDPRRGYVFAWLVFWLLVLYYATRAALPVHDVPGLNLLAPSYGLLAAMAIGLLLLLSRMFRG